MVGVDVLDRVQRGVLVEALEDLLAVDEDVGVDALGGDGAYRGLGLGREVGLLGDGEGLRLRIDLGGDEVGDRRVGLAVPGDGDGHFLAGGAAGGDRIGVDLAHGAVLVLDGRELADFHAVGVDVCVDVAGLIGVLVEPGLDVPVLEAAGADADGGDARAEEQGDGEDREGLPFAVFGFSGHLVLLSLVGGSA